MDYLTTIEFSKKWGISGRMVAQYCEKGRISGAVKKGKTWLIPSGAKRPFDKRCSRKNANIKGIDELQSEGHDIEDIDGLSAVFHTGNVCRSLGLTRETLRYYEEIGLISPQRDQHSQYREFDLFDLSRLMSIDFFKKRGFSLAEIHDCLIGKERNAYCAAMRQKIDHLREEISYLQETVDRLHSAERFCSNASGTLGEFSVRELPAYCVQESLPSVSSFDEYRDKVLRRLNMKREDILSNMVRTLTFDETGYKGSVMYIVRPATDTNCGGIFLECGRSLYTTLIADNNDPSVMERMFQSCHKWANQNGISFRGVVYIFIRLVMLGEKTDRNLYEIWIPIK